MILTLRASAAQKAASATTETTASFMMSATLLTPPPTMQWYQLVPFHVILYLPPSLPLGYAL